jgi:hypothetical protein
MRIAGAGDAAVKDLQEGMVEQQPHLTDRLLGRIMQSINGYQSKGVRWSAKTLTDHGRGAQEKKYGADFVGVLDIDLPEFKVRKGFLAQAKLLISGRMPTHEFNRLFSQCRQMLELSPAAFVFLQSLEDIRVIPAVTVVGARAPETVFHPDGFYSRSLSRFYEEHFECFIGDRQINEPSERNLENLQARSLQYLAASSSEE